MTMGDRWWCIECQELLTKVHGDETKHVMVHVPERLYSAICPERKVCKWLWKRSDQFWYTECPDEPRRFAYRLGEYCPGCGNKIEVVE